MRKLLLAIAPIVFCLPSMAVPVFYQYNLAASGLANADSDIDQTSPAWTGIWGGQLFTKGNLNVDVASKVQGGSSLASDSRLAAVPFAVGQTGAESWSGYKALKDAGSTDRTQATSLDIAPTPQKTEMVFLLMNTFWGAAGKGSVEVTLAFQSGNQLTFSLVGNTDIRDHHNAELVLGRKLWTNTIDSTVRSSANGGSQVTVNETDQKFLSSIDNRQHEVFRDVVTLVLPKAYWGEILSRIYLLDKGPSDRPVPISGDPDASRVWLWGVTTLSADGLTPFPPVEEIPEPASWLLVGTGIGLAGWMSRRRRV